MFEYKLLENEIKYEKDYLSCFWGDITEEEYEMRRKRIKDLEDRLEQIS
jgi:hypothetical protein